MDGVIPLGKLAEVLRRLSTSARNTSSRLRTSSMLGTAICTRSSFTTPTTSAKKPLPSNAARTFSGYAWTRAAVSQASMALEFSEEELTRITHRTRYPWPGKGRQHLGCVPGPGQGFCSFSADANGNRETQ